MEMTLLIQKSIVTAILAVQQIVRHQRIQLLVLHNRQQEASIGDVLLLEVREVSAQHAVMEFLILFKEKNAMMRYLFHLLNAKIANL